MSDKLGKILNQNLTPEEVDAILGASVQAKLDGELKKDLKKNLRDHYQVSKEPKRADLKDSKRRNLIFYMAAVAAGVAILILALNIFPFSSRNAQELASSYLATTEIYHSGVLKGDSNTPEIRMQAIRAFNAQQYAEAEQYFSQIEEKTKEDLFYSGICSIYNKKYENAISKLKPVSQGDSSYQTEASWYLAIAYLLNGQNAVAKDLLLTIKDSTWNHDKIQELLKTLE